MGKNFTVCIGPYALCSYKDKEPSIEEIEDICIERDILGEISRDIEQKIIWVGSNFGVPFVVDEVCNPTPTSASSVEAYIKQFGITYHEELVKIEKACGSPPVIQWGFHASYTNWSNWSK